MHGSEEFSMLSIINNVPAVDRGLVSWGTVRERDPMVLLYQNRGRQQDRARKIEKEREEQDWTWSEDWDYLFRKETSQLSADENTEYSVLGAPYTKYARPDPMTFMNTNGISEYLVMSVSLTREDRFLARCSEYPQGQP